MILCFRSNFVITNPNEVRRPSQDSDEFPSDNGGETSVKGDKPSTSCTLDAESYVSNIVSAFIPSGLCYKS